MSKSLKKGKLKEAFRGTVERKKGKGPLKESIKEMEKGVISIYSTGKEKGEDVVIIKTESFRRERQQNTALCK